jgi:NAD(P)H dehydrogenase (quinone)
MTTIAIVYDSPYGHTKKVADLVAEGARQVPSTTVVLHTAAEAAKDVTALNAADAIIFGAPTYMGSASAGFKAFADASSKAWFSQSWKDKIAAGFTNSGSLSGDKLATLQQFSILAAQQSMLWVGTGLMPPTHTSGHGGKPEEVNRMGSSLGLMTQSDNADAAHTPSSGDIETAKLFGARVASITAKWVK